MFDRLFSLLNAEEERLKRIAFQYDLRRQMDAEFDCQGRLWDRHGHEVSDETTTP